jgi:hypothetical protein
MPPAKKEAPGLAMSFVVLFFFWWFRNVAICGVYVYDALYPGSIQRYDTQCDFYWHPLWILSACIAVPCSLLSFLNSLLPRS